MLVIYCETCNVSINYPLHLCSYFLFLPAWLSALLLSINQLRCEFGRDEVTHPTCPSFPEIHYDRDAKAPNECAIVVRNIGEQHEGT